MNKNNQEIELRGLLSKEQYLSLTKELKFLGYSHEEDDKNSYFFAREAGIFKINDEISKNQVKISLKLGDEETGKLHEREVILARDQFDNLLSIFKDLGFTKFHVVEQKRNNFYLKDLDVELALKYTPDFQYHFEIEYLGDKIKLEDKIKEYLKDICVKFKITPLDETELLQKIKAIKKQYQLC